MGRILFFLLLIFPAWKGLLCRHWPGAFIRLFQKVSLVCYGMCLQFTVLSLWIRTWNGMEKKRKEIRALVCSCLQKAAAAATPQAAHTHTHTYTYTIYYIWYMISKLSGFFCNKKYFSCSFRFFHPPPFFFAVVFYCNVGKSSEKRMYERGRREEAGQGDCRIYVQKNFVCENCWQAVYILYYTLNVLQDNPLKLSG